MPLGTQIVWFVLLPYCSGQICIPNCPSSSASQHCNQPAISEVPMHLISQSCSAKSHLYAPLIPFWSCAEVEDGKHSAQGHHQQMLHEDGKENVARPHKAYKAGYNPLGASKDGLDGTGVASPRSPHLRPLEQHNSSPSVSSTSSPRPTTPGSSPLSPSRHRLAFSTSRPCAEQASPHSNHLDHIQPDQVSSEKGPASPSNLAVKAREAATGHHSARSDRKSATQQEADPSTAADKESQHEWPALQAAAGSVSLPHAAASPVLKAAQEHPGESVGERSASPQRPSGQRPPRPMAKPQPESLFGLPQIRKVYPSSHGRPGSADQRRPSGDSSEGADSSSLAGTSLATEQQDSQTLPDSLVEEVCFQVPSRCK